MKHLLIGCLSFLLIASTVQAAPWDKSARIDRAVSKYKKDRVESISGEVVKIYEKVPSFGKKKKDALGFHVVIDDGTEKIDIHLGPTWYLKSLEGRIEQGDTIEAVGSTKAAEVKDGKQKPKQMRAREIRKGGKVIMTLRDEDGRPVWSGTAFTQATGAAEELPEPDGMTTSLPGDEKSSAAP